MVAPFAPWDAPETTKFPQGNFGGTNEKLLEPPKIVAHTLVYNSMRIDLKVPTLKTGVEQGRMPDIIYTL